MIRVGLKTSCTRSIGRPKSCPAVGERDVVGEFEVVVHGAHAARSDVGTLLLDRRDQSGAVEFGDEIVEADGAAALDRVGRDHGGNSDDRQRGGRRHGAQFVGEREAVHVRHFDIGDDEIDASAPTASASNASVAEPTATTW